MIFEWKIDYIMRNLNYNIELNVTGYPIYLFVFTGYFFDCVFRQSLISNIKPEQDNGKGGRGTSVMPPS